MARMVSLSDEAYEALQRLKTPNQSFTDVVLEMAERERMRRVKALFGSWKMSATEADAFVKKIYERRSLSKPRKVEL